MLVGMYRPDGKHIQGMTLLSNMIHHKYLFERPEIT